MDALFHLMISFAGGYMLLRGLNVKFRWRELFILALVAGMIDMDHFARPFGEDVLIFHNVFFITLVPFAACIVLKRMKEHKLAFYAILMPIFWVGHILLDMASGMYGVMLFFPLSAERFLLPGWMNIWQVSTTYAIETAGFALAIYFGIIFAIIAANEYRKTGKLNF
jgi:hypothetical protein